MNERGRLQSLAWLFLLHSRRRQFAEFIIYKRQQFLGCVGIALFDRLKNTREIAHHLMEANSTRSAETKSDRSKC